MSSLERLMSAVATGVGEEEEVVPAEHATASSPQIARSRRARRISQRIRGFEGAKPSSASGHLRGRVLGIPFAGRSAEALVIDVSGDRGVLAADRTLRVAAQAHFAEGSFEGVVQEIAADERL